MDEIVYYDRYLQETCVEKVYGDKALRWTYGTLPGRISLNTVVKRALFSHWYGWRMDQPSTRSKIAPFIQEYELDASEFVRDVDEFANFNEFFYRQLRPEARPIDLDPASVVFPADGRHLCVPDLSDCEGLFIKGEMFDLATLIDDDALTEQYATGSLLLSRLCPVDYHRFHFPVAGVPGPTRLINGPLYSVNPIALRQNIEILATNKRCVTELQTSMFGKVLVMEIGATCVGGICQTYPEGVAIDKGDEKGYFRFGGSSTIVIFPPGAIEFDADLIENSQQNRELYARVGDRLGGAAAASRWGSPHREA
ncbi:phosphatidylserine decarboxylase [Allorhodopirellula solitaria]|uniref:Phosphatidylserine decarboxylase proenzyme n=1 Tax=Allorhodopirellula solitaria TaxID=2527987 RepID=A0A5C5X2S0_9BACT|nr:phosphatidylserine decarboxylase [Allorhodopirellula solitaria]TWT56561.1 Phosphatidylserine decarboxylase proenzyme [Allorhodopirellula solitaria]